MHDLQPHWTNQEHLHHGKFLAFKLTPYLELLLFIAGIAQDVLIKLDNTKSRDSVC